MSTVVYLVTKEIPVVLAPQSPTSLTGLVFRPGDLVGVDGSTCSRLDFWRLNMTSSHGSSGWIAADTTTLQPTTLVRHALQAFYVDNYPHGQFLLQQPIDRAEFQISTKLFLPFEKVYTNCHVTNGERVTFYKIQSSETSIGEGGGWLADRRLRLWTDEDPHDDITLLLPEELVSLGRFAYMAQQNVELRSLPDIGQASRTGRMVYKGDLVVASAIRQSPFGYNNGPFILLSQDGWLFEKRHGQAVLVPVEIEEGHWTLQVRGSTCVEVRRQPRIRLSDGQQGGGRVDTSTGSSQVLRVLHRNELVDCDARIESPTTGIWFYHVTGSNDNDSDDGGWIPEKTPGDRVLLVQVHTDPIVALTAKDGPQLTSATSTATSLGWSLDFVRGVAAIVEGTQEMEVRPERQLISFRNGTTQVHVHYGTQTVVLERPSYCKSNGSLSERAVVHPCTPQRLAGILQNPVSALVQENLQASPPTTPQQYTDLKTNDVLKQVNGYPVLLGSPAPARFQTPPQSGSHETTTSSTRAFASSSPASSITARRGVLDDEAQELQLRQKLVDCDLQMEKVTEQRNQLLDSLHPFDARHKQQAAHRLGRSPLVASPASTTASSPLFSTPLSLPRTGSTYSPLTSHQPPPPPPTTTSTTPVATPPSLPTARRYRVVWEDEIDGLSNSDPLKPMPPVAEAVAASKSPTEESSSLKPVLKPHSETVLTRLMSSSHVQQQQEEDEGAASDASSSSLGEQLNRRCGVCEQLFDSARARSVHCLKEHGKYSCNYCTAVFDYSSALHRHRDERDHW